MNLQIHTHQTICFSSQLLLSPTCHQSTTSLSPPDQYYLSAGNYWGLVPYNRPPDSYYTPRGLPGRCCFCFFALCHFLRCICFPAAHLVVDSVTIKLLGCRLLSHTGTLLLLSISQATSPARPEKFPGLKLKPFFLHF